MAKNSQVLDQLKYETSAELGIDVGADQTSRNNGRVGGNMVRKLVAIAEQQLQRK